MVNVEEKLRGMRTANNLWKENCVVKGQREHVLWNLGYGVGQEKGIKIGTSRAIFQDETYVYLM